MASKRQSISVIDFITSNLQQSFFEKLPQTFAIEVPNEHLLDMLRVEIRKSSNKTISAMHGQNITTEWIDNKYGHLDLFAEDELIIIYESEKIKKEVVTYLNECAANSSISTLLLFNKDLDKKWKGEGLKVKKPPFWEGEKIFICLVRFFGINISNSAIKMVAPFLDQEVNFAFEFSKTLKSLNTVEMKDELIQSLLPVLKINQFDLVDLINAKKTKDYFRRLSEVESFDELSSLISFSLTHFQKILSPLPEGKLNKYQRSILQAANRWSEREVSQMMGVLKDTLILCRLKNKKAFIEVMKASV